MQLWVSPLFAATKRRRTRTAVAVRRTGHSLRSGGRISPVLLVLLGGLLVIAILALFNSPPPDDGRAPAPAPQAVPLPAAETAIDSPGQPAQHGYPPSTGSRATTPASGASADRAGPVPDTGPETATGGGRVTDADAGDDTDPPAGELAIAGSVLDQDGMPLADIAVSAVRHDAGSAPGPATATATSDRLGMFRLPDLTAGEYLLEAEGGPDRHSARLQVRAGAAAVELVLRARAERIVHGQVRNALGDPLADVRVHAPGGPPGTRTDAGGKYRIGVISRESGQAPVLDFELAGYRSRRLRVQGEAPEVRMDVDLEAAAPPATVLGSVYGPRGEAVADALVWLASPATGAYHQVTSDIAGEYRIDGVEAGSGYQLGVEPPDGYRARTLGPLTLQTPTAMHDIRLESRGEAGLIGRLVDPDGRPLAGFPLWLRSADAGNVTVPVTTDASGRFHAEPVPAGQVHLQTASQPRLRAGSIQLDSGEVRSVEIPLDWGEEWMFGRVVDARDLPVAGARLTLQWSVPVAEFTSTSLRHATTDPDGHFAFANLGARDYRLTVQAPGRETFRQFTRRDGEDLLIRLPGSSGG